MGSCASFIVPLLKIYEQQLPLIVLILNANKIKYYYDSKLTWLNKLMILKLCLLMQ